MIMSRVVQMTPEAMNRDQHPLARRQEGSSHAPLHSTSNVVMQGCTVASDSCSVVDQLPECCSRSMLWVATHWVCFARQGGMHLVVLPLQ